MYPQSKAIELAKVYENKKLETIGKYGCCAFVAMWLMGLESDYTMLKIIGEEIGHTLGDDCTVKWKEFFACVVGKTVEVEFRNIKSIEEVENEYRCAVRFDYNGKSHWVGVQYGELKFNPLSYSQCVDKGRPTTARIIKYI